VGALFSSREGFALTANARYSWVGKSQVSDNPKTTKKSHGQILTEISDGMVALLKDYYGVGPTQAKTYYQDDLVVAVLRGGFTRVEQTLLAGDRGRAVIEQRMAFQEVMRQRFEAVIQHATGREVIGFMSGNQQDPDMICEVFVLSPTSLLEESELRALGKSSADHNGPVTPEA